MNTLQKKMRTIGATPVRHTTAKRKGHQQSTNSPFVIHTTQIFDDIKILPVASLLVISLSVDHIRRP